MLQQALTTICSALQERKTAKIRWKGFVCFLYITQLQTGWKEYCNEDLLMSNPENALHNLKNKWYTSVSWVATVKVLASQVKPSVMSSAPEMFTRAGTRVKSEIREMLCDPAGHWPKQLCLVFGCYKLSTVKGSIIHQVLFSWFSSELFQIKCKFQLPDNSHWQSALQMKGFLRALVSSQGEDACSGLHCLCSLHLIPSLFSFMQETVVWK